MSNNPGLSRQDIQTAVATLKRLQLIETFTTPDLTSRPSDFQMEYLKDIHNYKIRVVRAGGQSGKSSTISRELSWVLEETHPFWKRPKQWGNEPLFILFSGPTMRLMYHEMWLNKIKPLLTDPDDWKEVNSGNVLQYIINKKNGTRLLFVPHGSSASDDVDRMKGFAAHFAFVDELPKDIKLLEEIARRVQAKDGWLSLAFTPTQSAPSIKRWCDAVQPPLGKTYRFNMLSNPIYVGREDEILARYKGMPADLIQSIMEGDWYSEESAVFQVPPNLVQELPSHYHPQDWRHIEASDPALSSKHGLIVIAEDPKTSHWYVVKASYLENMLVPEDLIRRVAKETEHYKITRRVADPAANWYIQQAVRTSGLYYITPFDKGHRLSEMLKNFQQALGTQLFVTPHCMSVLEELSAMTYKNSDKEGQIVNKRSYHLTDALIYGWDCRHKDAPPASRAVPTYTERLHANMRADDAREAAANRKKNKYFTKIKVHKWK